MGCDVTAVKGDEMIVIELKQTASLDLLIQAAQRQRVTDSVYVAVVKPAGRGWRRWRGIRHLLRRLQMGLIFVDCAAAPPQVEVVFHPLPYDRKRNRKARRAIIQEAAARYDDYNPGGSVGRKLITAYRERAIFVACCLDTFGPLAPRQLRAAGSGPKTLSILSNNFYGWFERVDRGIYAIKPLGRSALAKYPVLAERFRKNITQLAPAQSPGP